MQKLLRSAALAAAAVLSVALSSASGAGIVNATVPFDFVVRHRLLPAGEYTIRQLGTADGAAMTLENSKQRFTVIFQTEAASGQAPDAPSTLVFREVGGRQVLQQVWMGPDVARQVVHTRTEAQLEKVARVTHDRP